MDKKLIAVTAVTVIIIVATLGLIFGIIPSRTKHSSVEQANVLLVPTPKSAWSTALSLKSISPSTISPQSDQTLTLSGSGFNHVSAILLGDTDVGKFTIRDDSTIVFTLPPINSGTYNIIVVTDLESGATLPHALTVTGNVHNIDAIGGQ